jgi:hypothetical protein
MILLFTVPQWGIKYLVVLQVKLHTANFLEEIHLTLTLRLSYWTSLWNIEFRLLIQIIELGKLKLLLTNATSEH